MATPPPPELAPPAPPVAPGVPPVAALDGGSSELLQASSPRKATAPPQSRNERNLAKQDLRGAVACRNGTTHPIARNADSVPILAAPALARKIASREAFTPAMEQSTDRRPTVGRRGLSTGARCEYP